MTAKMLVPTSGSFDSTSRVSAFTVALSLSPHSGDDGFVVV
jgi:hypothetical protein